MSVVAFSGAGSRQKAAFRLSVPLPRAGAFTLIALLVVLAVAVGGCSTQWPVADARILSAGDLANIKAVVRVHTGDPVVLIVGERRDAYRVVTAPAVGSADGGSGFFRFTRAASGWAVEVMLGAEDVAHIKALIRKQTADPILLILPWSADYVKVETGFIRGPLAGNGSWFKLQRTPGGWVISERGEWVS
jgi:hypothetical protein